MLPGRGDMPTSDATASADDDRCAPMEVEDAHSVDQQLPHIEVGHQYWVRFDDNRFHKATVVTQRPTSGGQYYVHFDGMNRRLDRWVSRSVILPMDAGRHDDGSFATSPLEGIPKTLTRNQLRLHNEINHIQTPDHMDPTTERLEREHENVTRVRNIDRVVIGCYLIHSWYYSPFPDEFSFQKIIFVCEYCLSYMKAYKSYRDHLVDCSWRQPPGSEIYRSNADAISVFEIDGSVHKRYCQNLCLLAKCFLDHKTLFYDVELFYFYVLCEVDKQGCHVVGYFSKEKESLEGNNLACILVFPPFQRRGYGKFLIHLSYELSKIERRVGSPEKPISDMGKLSYKSYWLWTILQTMQTSWNQTNKALTVKELSRRTAIAEADILETLQSLNLMRYWKGQHVVCVTQKLIEDYLNGSSCKRPEVLVDRKLLKWRVPPAHGRPDHLQGSIVPT